MKTLLIGALAAAALTSAQAQEAIKIRPLIGMSWTFGGEKLFEAQFTSGEDATVRAGSGFAFFGGAEWTFSDTFAVQATLGYHSDRINAENGGANFSRVPVSVLGYYSFTNQFRLGAGIESATSVKYKSHGAAGDLNVPFKASTGPVVEAEYLFSPKFAVKLRAAQHTFQVKDAPTIEVEGNYFGISMSAAF